MSVLGLVCTGCLSLHIDDVNVDENTAALALLGNSTGFLDITTEHNGEERPAVVYVPRDYDPDEEWPLIIFLHGAGERGDDGVRQTHVGIGPAIRKNPDRFRALVFMPQCPTGQWWGVVPGRGGDESGHDHINDGLEQIMDAYNIDADRVSLTGLSMGGFGTFSYGARFANDISAFMPICGGGDPESAEALSKRPMWVFHGEADSVVPMDRSKVMVDAIRETGGSVKFTTYPGVGHNSWDEAYSKKQGGVEWLLAQTR
jgi:predicted peptidase